MHMIVYLEHFILSLSIIVFFIYWYGLAYDEPFKFLMEDNEEDNYFGYYSILMPFCPLSSLIMHIPIPLGSSYLVYDFLPYRFVFKIFILIVLIVLISASMLLIALLAQYLSCKYISVRYEYLIKGLKLSYNLCKWFIF